MGRTSDTPTLAHLKQKQFDLAKELLDLAIQDLEFCEEAFKDFETNPDSMFRKPPFGDSGFMTMELALAKSRVNDIQSFIDEIEQYLSEQ